jgi:methylmalonyl-CoA mutase N-terminal domain/subunit
MQPTSGSPSAPAPASKQDVAAGPAVRRRPFTTVSGRPVERFYTPRDVAGIDYARDLNDPGGFPYTRGIHSTGYRGKLWTMRQFAGFGTPEDTNARYKELLRNGGTGLSVAFDLPTLMGRDPDHELSLGEVGSAACRWRRWPIWRRCSRASPPPTSPRR